MAKERTQWKKEPFQYRMPPIKLSNIDPKQFMNDWSKQSQELVVGNTTLHLYYRKTQYFSFKSTIEEIIHQLKIYTPEGLEHLAIYFGGSANQRIGATKKNAPGGAAASGIVDGVVHTTLFFPNNEKVLLNQMQTIDTDRTLFIGTPPMLRIPMRTVIAHELAHIDDFSKSGWEMKNFRSRTFDLVRVSHYAKYDDVEAWAEAKSLWQVGSDEEMGEFRDLLYSYAFLYDWVKII